ncbi:MAG: glycosyltransferase family 4 protein [Thermoplasmata archaeon]|nr:glycosyltransferase family 4 protein [Thermoplasmata archaeon]
MADGRDLRVLYAGAVLAPDWTGGEPVFAELLMRGLMQRGVKVLREGSRRTLSELARLAFVPYDAEPWRVARYRRRLRELRPDAVLAGFDFDCSWVIAARKEGVPVFVCVQIYWPTCPIGTRYIDGVGVCSSPGFMKCLRHISRADMSPNLGLPVPVLSPPLALALYSKLLLRPSALSQADALVANSVFAGQVLTAAGYTNVRVIHNGVDTGLFRAEPWGGGPKVVLYPVARSRQERKGYAHFVRLARAVHAQFPEVRFRILNDPGDELIEGTPYLSHLELAELFRAAYLVVVPGLWDEPFGFVAAEAMASGRPVVMYDGGGSAELIENGRSGVLVARGDEEALKRAVTGMLNDEPTAHRMGQAARARIEAQFGFPLMAERFLQLIREALPERSLRG